MGENKKEVDSIYEAIIKIEKESEIFCKMQASRASILIDCLEDLSLDELKELSNKLKDWNDKGNHPLAISADVQDIVDRRIADIINGKKNRMSMKELGEKLVEISFASSNAYTKAVESEDRSARIARIQNAMNQVRFKEALSYEELLSHPRPLK